jgi:Arc/MetJ-type ribon-helix-helix transcriptional regulator
MPDDISDPLVALREYADASEDFRAATREVDAASIAASTALDRVHTAEDKLKQACAKPGEYMSNNELIAELARRLADKLMEEQA